MPFLYDKPLYDDAFYGFQVKKNIASGKGITDNFGNYVTGGTDIIYNYSS